MAAVLVHAPAFGVILDRVAATVDDAAITQSELAERYEVLRRANPAITQGEALETMINRSASERCKEVPNGGRE